MSEVRIYNKILCPSLWHNFQLDKEVRVSLLQIAKDFYEKTRFKAPVKDICLMGSSANFNWTPESDVDVHILIDFNQLRMPEDTAEKMAKTTASQWNIEHDIRIKGHKVEINFQNISDTKPHVTGIYSLVRNRWVRVPKRELPQVNKVAIVSKYTKLKDYIEKSIQSGERDYMKTVKEYIDAYRQYGLDSKGELSTENITFKLLRSRGILKKLKEAINKTYDQQMSVDEVSNSIQQNDYIGGVIDGEVRGEMLPSGKAKSAVHGDYRGLYSGQNNTNWRYFSNKNILIFNLEAEPGDVDRVKEFLRKRGIVNPIVKVMYRYEEVIGESKFSGQVWLGWVDPNNHQVFGGSGEDYEMHDQLANIDHKYVFQLEWEDAPKWRYRKDLNTVYWWSHIPDKDIQDSLNRWIKRHIGGASPQHIRLRNISRDERDIKAVSQSHGTMEGYGAGKPEEDRLHIPGHRWQIKSKDAPKTPKMEVEFINESTGEYKKGECFRNVLKWARQNDDGNTLVVHGKVKVVNNTFDHAWVEQGNVVIDPTTGEKMKKDKWYQLTNAIPIMSYTPHQADINMVRSKNLGPWTPEEIEDRFTNNDKLDTIQAALDAVGVEPTIGTVADATNVVISLLRAAKDKTSDERKSHLFDAAISAISILPMADFVKILKIRKYRKIATKAARAIKVGGEHLPKSYNATDEGFDPTSVGPNPAGTEGQTDPEYYRMQNAKMRKM